MELKQHASCHSVSLPGPKSTLDGTSARLRVTALARNPKTNMLRFDVVGAGLRARSMSVPEIWHERALGAQGQRSTAQIF